MKTDVKGVLIGLLFGVCIFLMMGLSRKDNLEKQLDSLKYINLMSIQDEYREKQNQLLEDITSDYESLVQARINDAKIFEDRLFKLLENKSIITKVGTYQGFSDGQSSILYMLNTETGELYKKEPLLKKWYRVSPKDNWIIDKQIPSR